MNFSAKHRVRTALVIAVVAITSLGACAAGPINVGMLPISGTSIMSVHVQACAQRAGALRITTDHHQIDPDRVQLQIDRWAPTTGPLPISTWSHDGRHAEFTTPSVEAGDCFHFFINTVSMCCDPIEPAYMFGFDYRIDYLD
ncbi:MAG: hypothetical protein ACK4V6_06050 [Microthrixaceae bacterium]